MTTEPFDDAPDFEPDEISDRSLLTAQTRSAQIEAQLFDRRPAETLLIQNHQDKQEWQIDN